MKKINSFILIGGDTRQLYMADYFESLGYKVSIYGLPDKGRENIYDLRKTINEYDAVVLPLPVTKDEKKIYSLVPMKETIDDIISLLTNNHTVFAGMINKNTEAKLKKKTSDIYDYFKREDVTVMNTIPTVQGILKAMIENIEYTIHSSECAVFGYGRVARITADVLKSLGANVTVCARKSGDIATAFTNGYNGVYISDFYKQANKYDILINTVPALVIDKKILNNLKKDCLIIDVASSPFGTDFAYAYEAGINAIQCSSLPGKVAPKSAGKIIADGILNIIKEGNENE